MKPRGILYSQGPILSFNPPTNNFEHFFNENVKKTFSSSRQYFKESIES